MSNPNVAIAQRWFEKVWNQRDPKIMEEVLTEESCCHSESGCLHGAESFKSIVHSPFLLAFPDLHIKVEGTVAEGDNVVVRWGARGTHMGDSLGFPATGRQVFFRGMTWIRFENGKMMEGWDCWNQAALLEALRSPTLPPLPNALMGHLKVAAPGFSLDG